MINKKHKLMQFGNVIYEGNLKELSELTGLTITTLKSYRKPSVYNKKGNIRKMRVVEVDIE